MCLLSRIAKLKTQIQSYTDENNELRNQLRKYTESLQQSEVDKFHASCRVAHTL